MTQEKINLKNTLLMLLAAAVSGLLATIIATLPYILWSTTISNNEFHYFILTFIFLWAVLSLFFSKLFLNWDI